MAFDTLPVVEYPDPILRQVCEECDIKDKSLKKLAKQMAKTMYKNNGCGIAAPQVGVLKRIIVIDCDQEDGRQDPITLINPEILELKGELVTEEEGCLSCPGKWGYTIRPEAVTLKALDRTGKERTYTADGLKAQAFCHECDHLEGVLFLDKVVRMADPEEIESR